MRFFKPFKPIGTLYDDVKFIRVDNKNNVTYFFKDNHTENSNYYNMKIYLQSPEDLIEITQEEAALIV